MQIDDLKNLPINYGEIYFDYDLKKLNWFNIGGKTKVFLTHITSEQIEEAKNEKLLQYVIQIQKTIRGNLIRKKYK